MNPTLSIPASPFKSYINQVRVLLVIPILILLLLFPFSSKGQSNTKKDNEIVELKAKLDSLFKAYNVPGAQVALIHKHSLIFNANFGYADVNMKIPVTDSTMFRVAFICKSFLALGVLKEIEQKKIGLNDELKDLVPEIKFENSWEDQAPVKVVNILEHTTGFDEIHAHNVSGEGLSTKECLEADWRSRKSRWMPGTYYSYCNSAVPMLAFAIEKKTEQSFEDYMKYNVFLPIRMNTSSYFFTPYVQKQLAKGYSYKDGQETPYRHSLMRCSGALTTNATEMSSFIQMMLNRGRMDTVSFLSPESITRRERLRRVVPQKLDSKKDMVWVLLQLITKGSSSMDIRVVILGTFPTMDIIMN